MKKILLGIDKVMSAGLITMMALMTIGVIVSVVLRYIFNITFVQAEEGITMIFIGTTYFGAALCMRERDHISISLLVDIFPPLIRKILRVFASLVIGAVTIIVFKYSLIWIDKVGSMISPALQLPFSLFYMMVPVSSVILIFYSLIDILAQFFDIPEAVRGYSMDEIDEEAVESMKNALQNENFEVIDQENKK